MILGVEVVFLFAFLCSILSVMTLVMNWLTNFGGYRRFENVKFKASHWSIKFVRFDDSLYALFNIIFSTFFL